MRGRIDGKNTRTYTRTFQVKVSAKSDGPAVVLAATGIPRFGDQYVTGTEIDLGARCVTREYQETESPYLRRVQVEYSSESPDPTKQDENPLLRAADIDYSFAKYSKPFTRDVDGRAVLNSAELPYDPPIERDDTRGILIITRNEPVFLNAIADAYQDSVNSDAFFGRPAGTWKCQPMRARPAYENGVAFIVVTYEFEYRKEGWRVEVLDQGRSGRTFDVGATIKPFTDAGTPLTDPVPLDGSGHRLSDVTTTLPADIDKDSMNIEVASTARFPTNAGLLAAGKPAVYIRIGNEIMKLTANNTPNLAVVRGQQQTTKVAHLSGSEVFMEPYYLSFKAYEERPFALLALP